MESPKDFDLIFMDAQMSETGRLEATRVIRATGWRVLKLAWIIISQTWRHPLSCG